MHPNTQLLTSFYEAFARRDYTVMQACYAPDAVFSDPVFSNLRGKQPGKMWEMLCKNGKELHITSRNIEADDMQGKAEWIATYTFSATGRKVVNHVRARFSFRDGRIIHHTDQFSFYRWARQAFGLNGLLLGWTSFFRNKVQEKAMGNLQAFMSRQ